MKVLVTGHDGYVGAVAVGFLAVAGHDVIGVDTGWFDDRAFTPPAPVTAWRRDVRDLTVEDLATFDAVVHLAALSNDPLGDLDATLTDAINHRASVQLAQRAKQAGVSRFVFASSCSLYGAARDAAPLDERAPFRPVTPYGASKVHVEASLGRLADSTFSPVCLRNATAYGVSPKLRGDLMVNDLVARAVTTGEVLIKSDGTPWRPLVHVTDMARAMVAALAAPRQRIHNEAFNVGRDGENYQVRDVAALVAAEVPGSQVVYAPGGEADARDYRVDFSKIARQLPEFRPRWTVADGVAELADAYRRHGLSLADLESGRYHRLRAIASHRQAGCLGPDLRWRGVAGSAVAGRAVAAEAAGTA
ncbi:SDR family oxidoreductase [Egibacter rhizosphaerae]|uniref:SDR family oxidoreductase n=1 Tax=Egibacter rhizosphaerae TaxID=1670831 RepID=A0A411YGG2_9ACTN|nr:SDR family oxidoreductase [Egibacter rhizosphaerae]QBI20293.1 SDR family oxidoreductase [Egibacter rhizosphaerae]